MLLEGWYFVGNSAEIQRANRVIRNTFRDQSKNLSEELAAWGDDGFGYRILVPTLLAGRWLGMVTWTHDYGPEENPLEEYEEILQDLRTDTPVDLQQWFARTALTIDPSERPDDSPTEKVHGELKRILPSYFVPQLAREDLKECYGEVFPSLKDTIYRFGLNSTNFIVITGPIYSGESFPCGVWRTPIRVPFSVMQKWATPAGAAALRELERARNGGKFIPVTKINTP
ncbi:hypothetical protein [Acidithiobacillus sp. AMEEHan]|uniref:hypothetical protein n=1 Tax=Acidithiobacillus sp. AMEEHan TaxID=2994951 RepID=UPI0027E3C047|nr:hypothetical protein [Acidithiobacillus sp. AMEEHan]